jgi:cell division protein FtsW (lipid II flippase)
MRQHPGFRGTEVSLLLLPSLLAIIGLITIVVVPRHKVSWSWGDIWVSIAFASALIGISLTFSIRRFRGDQVLLPLCSVLAMLGLLLIQRLSPDLTAQDPTYATLAQKQFIYMAAGLALMWLIAMLGGPLRLIEWLPRYKYTWLLLSLTLQAATFVVGVDVGGARLWIQVGPVQVQPSEIIKITLVIFLAGFLDEKRDLIGSSWNIGPLALPPIPYLLPMIAMWGAALLTLVVLNDLGSALLFFGVFMVMLYVTSGKAIYVIVGTIAFAIACYLAWLAFSRIDIRVQNWLDPWKDAVNGFQPVQSDYSLASGGVLGTGLGLGDPTLIPAVATDYVFSAIGEELGLLGTLGIVALSFLIMIRGYLIALRTRDGFAQLLATGLTTIVAIQTIIIIGGVIRLIPLTGITLPFISYGGSSTICNFVILGLLLYISSLPRRA